MSTKALNPKKETKRGFEGELKTERANGKHKKAARSVAVRVRRTGDQKRRKAFRLPAAETAALCMSAREKTQEGIRGPGETKRKGEKYGGYYGKEGGREVRGFSGRHG